MSQLTPFLWFQKDLKTVVKFYKSVFRDSKILDFSDLGGGVKTAVIKIRGQKLNLMSCPSKFKFNESFSLFISCKDQREINYFWDKLSKGGQIQMCGWLKDRFGLSWQITPKNLHKYLGHKDPKKAAKAMNAMLKMQKFEIKKLEG